MPNGITKDIRVLVGSPRSWRSTICLKWWLLLVNGSGWIIQCVTHRFSPNSHFQQQNVATFRTHTDAHASIPCINDQPLENYVEVFANSCERRVWQCVSSPEVSMVSAELKIYLFAWWCFMEAFHISFLSIANRLINRTTVQQLLPSNMRIFFASCFANFIVFFCFVK